MLRLRIRGQGYLSLLPKGTVGPGPFGLGLSKDVSTGALSSVQRSWDPVVWKPQRADVVCFEHIWFSSSLSSEGVHARFFFLPFPELVSLKAYFNFGQNNETAVDARLLPPMHISITTLNMYAVAPVLLRISPLCYYFVLHN